MSIMDNNSTASTLIQPFSDEIQDHKRLKRTVSIAESIRSNGVNLYTDGSSNNNISNISRTRSSSNLNSLSKLHFRDHIRTYTLRYHAAEAVEEAAAAMFNADHQERGAEEDGNADGMRLVRLLVACAEAVACCDRTHASVLLSALRANALVFGSSFQRVASCFVQGLVDRLALVQPLDAALSLIYENCPHIQFGHFVANATILEAFEGKSILHVVDLGMTLGLAHGHQWCAMIPSLADREGQPPCHLRITGVGLFVDRFRVIGDELGTYAKNMGISFEFSVVESNLENLKTKDIKHQDGEVLVVNSILQLHCVVKESRGALNSLLQIIHKLSHSGPFFLGRFMEALHYYSAIFDSLDVMLPKYDTKRAKMEQFYFAEEIKNIVSCEGPARVERHEKVDQWRRRLSRAGFQVAPMKLIAQAKQWLGKNKGFYGYTIVEDKGCLVLGWKSRPIVAASCWKC
ncbi:hypothetical protein I3842_11G011000 [Carya illinoinensis]|uniref:Uncharacterized protein n=1 Tax=Carya illinoinensis TaxID=32201 RepID=A0A922IYH6_CARIL|nr:hypothetical protein I3842_11G011000 [Carya illinoinensis]